LHRLFHAAAHGLILIVSLLAPACGRADTAKMTELRRVRSGEMDVVVLSARDALRHGKDTFVVEFKAASSGSLVDVGVVRASANMPMAGSPMFGSIDVKRTDVPGRYEGNAEFSMAGTWRMSIEWDGPAGHGSAVLPANVQ
jgi:hypothetical protein